MNTTKNKQAGSWNNGEFGESGEGQHSQNLKLDHGAIDQNDNRWIRVKQNGRVAYIPHSALATGNVALVSEIFRKHGMTVLSKSTVSRLAQQAEGADYSERIMVADRTGWVDDCFAFGDGTVFKPKDYQGVIIEALVPSPNFGERGTTEDYWAAFIPVIKGQEFLLFALGMAFLPPLLELFRKKGISMDNVIFDACGASSNGKTGCFIRLPGSIWGTGSQRTGFGRNWNTTAGGVEDTLRELNCCFLGLDEANKAGKSARDRAEFIAQAVFKIASGDIRRSQTAAYDERAYTAVCASTRNVPLADYVEEESETAEAIAVRCNTILIPRKRRFGIFTHLPRGFSSSAELAAHVTTLTQQHFGAPIRTFLQRLVNERGRDEASLLNRMMEYFSQFMSAMNIPENDGQMNRKAAAFAMVYASARLARSWKIFPDGDEVGNLKIAYQKVWRCLAKESAANTDHSPGGKIANYVSQHAGQLLVLGEPDVMDDTEFNAHPGFLKMGKGKTQELVLSLARFADFKLSKKALIRLESEGILICDAGRYDAKRKVRVRLEGDDNERVRVINLHALGVRVKNGVVKNLE